MSMIDCGMGAFEDARYSSHERMRALAVAQALHSPPLPPNRPQGEKLWHNDRPTRP